MPFFSYLLCLLNNEFVLNEPRAFLLLRSNQAPLGCVKPARAANTSQSLMSSQESSARRRSAWVVPLDSVKETLRWSLSLLLSLLGRCWCFNHGLHPCCPISGRRACSLIFCLNHWLKRPPILDVSKSATSSCQEGTDVHLLKTMLSSPALSQGATAATCAAGDTLPVRLSSRCV